MKIRAETERGEITLSYSMTLEEARALLNVINVMATLSNPPDNPIDALLGGAKDVLETAVPIAAEERRMNPRVKDVKLS